MSYELAEMDSDGVKFSTTGIHVHPMGINLVSEPSSSSQAYLKSFYPLISRLTWLWLSHFISIFLTYITWTGSPHQPICVLFPASPGSGLLWLDREGQGIMLSVYISVVEMGMQSLIAKTGVLKYNGAEFAIPEGVLECQFEGRNLGLAWLPLHYMHGQFIICLSFWFAHLCKWNGKIWLVYPKGGKDQMSERMSQPLALQL